MDARLEAILHSCINSDLNKVVAGALDVPQAALAGQPQISEIAAPHNDLRTLGIIRVSGAARLPGGGTEHCSAVAKVIDLAIAPGAGAFWTHPENEDIVYERGYFAGGNLPFCPARCYCVSRSADTVKVLWLEDLGGLRGAPFDLRELAAISRHLGHWNGFHFGRTPDLPFETSRDLYLARWTGAGFGKLLEKFKELADHPSTRQLYGNLAPGVAFELHDLVSRLNEGTRALPHGLASATAAPTCSLARKPPSRSTGPASPAIPWASMPNA